MEYKQNALKRKVWNRFWKKKTVRLTYMIVMFVDIHVWISVINTVWSWMISNHTCRVFVFTVGIGIFQCHQSSSIRWHWWSLKLRLLIHVCNFEKHLWHSKVCTSTQNLSTSKKNTNRSLSSDCQQSNLWKRVVLFLTGVGNKLQKLHRLSNFKKIAVQFKNVFRRFLFIKKTTNGVDYSPSFVLSTINKRTQICYP